MNSIADRLSRFRVGERLLNLFDAICVAGPDQTIFQNANLGDVGRDDGQAGGEVFTYLQRVGGERQFVYRKRV